MIARRLFVVVLFVLGTGLLGACRGPDSSEVTQTEEGVLRLGAVEAADTVARAVAPSGRPLVLEGIRGSVHLTGAASSTADLSFVRRGRGEDAEAARSVLDEISITESGTEAAYTYTLAADDKKDYAAVDIRGQVPRQATLRIDRISGPVHLNGIEGTLTIKHEHGSVDVDGAAAPIQVNIKNGDVHVGFRALPSDGPIRLQTANGDLRVGLPPEAAVQVDAQTNVGTIRTQGLSLSPGRLAPVNAGARYEAEQGSGGPVLELRTQNGSITLQAADTTEADRVRATPASDLSPTDTTVTSPMTPDTMSPDTAAADTTRS